MVKRRSPFWTTSPSLKCIPVSVPPTWARSSTCSTAENWPRKPTRESANERLAHDYLWCRPQRSGAGLGDCVGFETGICRPSDRDCGDHDSAKYPPFGPRPLLLGGAADRLSTSVGSSSC